MKNPECDKQTNCFWEETINDWEWKIDFCSDRI